MRGFYILKSVDKGMVTFLFVLTNFTISKFSNIRLAIS